MQYLNVKLLGLSGRPHPALLDINHPRECQKLRLHIKFLSGDFLTGQRRSKDQPGTDPSCTLCLHPLESVEHILAVCSSLSEERQRLYPQLLNTVSQVQPNCRLLQNHTSSQLTQFILDCTSIHLEDDYRVPAHNPRVGELFQLSRDWCFAMNNARARQLKSKSKNKH